MERTPATVHAVDDVGPDTIAVTLESPDGFDALPGQFVKVYATVGDEAVARFYTISSPTSDESFELTIGIDPDGTLSPWLRGLDAGAELEFEGPFGATAYDGDGDVVVLAGGPGVGPAIAIGERAQAAGHHVAVVYQDDDPVHESRLGRLAAGGADVFFVNGEVDAAVAAALNDGQVFIFGFKAFVDTALAAIDAAGGDADSAMVESFG